MDLRQIENLLYNLKHYEQIANQVKAMPASDRTEYETELAQGVSQFMFSLKNSYYALTGEEYHG